MRTLTTVLLALFLCSTCAGQSKPDNPQPQAVALAGGPGPVASWAHIDDDTDYTCAAPPAPCPSPKPMTTKKFVILQSLNFASTVFNATGSHYGATRCIHEGDSRFIPIGKMTPEGEVNTTLKRSLPVDAVILGVSYFLHKKGNDKWASRLPLVSGGVQTGIGLTQYSAGCF